MMWLRGVFEPLSRRERVRANSKLLVGGQGEEVTQLIRMGHRGNQRGGGIGTAGAGVPAAAQAMGVRDQRLVEQGEVDRRVIGELEGSPGRRSADRSIGMMQPLPQLGAG